jgi:hypothetical protein
MEFKAQAPQTGWSRQITTAFFAVVALGVLTHARVLSANDASRWDTVWALNSGRGFVIDEAPYQTVDKVRKDGSFYSSKPPLLPVAAAGLLRLAHPAGVADAGSIPWNDILLVLLWINVIPMTILLYLYDRFLSENAFGGWTKAYCMLAAAFGTFLGSYSITLSNHVVSSYCAFFGLYAYWKIARGSTDSLPAYFFCGIFTALAAVDELQAGMLPLLVFLSLLRRNRRKALSACLPAMGAVLCFFLILDYVAYGDVRPFYLMPEYGRYDGSYWNDPSGTDALHEPKAVYLFHVVLGHHGIFSLSPVLLLAAWGLPRAKLPGGFRPIAVVCSVTTLLFVVLCTCNYGGWCQGMRWMFWLIPFALFALPWFVEANAGRVGRWALSWGALAFSMVTAFSPFFDESGPWSMSLLHYAWQKCGWIDY